MVNQDVSDKLKNDKELMILVKETKKEINKMAINLAFFISQSFSLWVHILYSDVIISIVSFFIVFPILNIFILKSYPLLNIKLKKEKLKND